MIDMYKIHFTDNYGQGAITCESDEEWVRVRDNLVSDPNVNDIWTEFHDDEEGWQA